MQACAVSLWAVIDAKYLREVSRQRLIGCVHVERVGESFVCVTILHVSLCGVFGFVFAEELIMHMLVSEEGKEP
jgi:hypothetical protein